VISPSSSCLEKKALHQSSESWKLVFHLPVVGEVGGEILFKLRVLNSVWILVLAIEGMGLPSCNGCVGSVATRVLLGFNFIKWFGLYCRILCD
jgi:hypothetical protein